MCVLFAMLTDQFPESHSKQEFEWQNPEKRTESHGRSTAARDQNLDSNDRATMHQRGPGRAKELQMRPGNVQEGTVEIGTQAESRPNSSFGSNT